MPGDRKTPPIDRDVYRPKTSPGLPIVRAAVPVGEFTDKPITGVEMAPLQEIAERVERGRSATKSSELAIARLVGQTSATTTERLSQQDVEIAEVKSSVAEVKDEVTTIKVHVAEMRGELKHLPKQVDDIRDAVKQIVARDHLTATKAIEMQTVMEISRVEVDTAKELGTVKLRLTRGEWVTKFLAIAGTGAAIVLALIEAGRC